MDNDRHGYGTFTRRALLGAAAGGLSGAAFARDAGSGASMFASSDPLAPKTPHFAPRAKRVIFLFMNGGVSHVDSFDPKPALRRDDGKPRGEQTLLGPQWSFSADSSCGTEVSDLFPALRKQMDEVCLVRSMVALHGDHFQAALGMHTGSTNFVRPSLGAWVSYALGTENPNLPPFVVIAPRMPYAGEQLWGSDFLPACHQGVRIVPGDEPVPNLIPRLAPELQASELDLLERTNRRHLEARGGDAVLAARMRSWRIAQGMQVEAPEVFDLGRESDATLELYGLKRGDTKSFAWQCLVARRLVERGVRFVELMDVGASNNWDAHGNMASHGRLAKAVDAPVAGLLADLRQRGLLDETLVVWTTEFGRSPHADKKNPKGRGHHRSAYSSWLAGAGVRSGTVYGESDEHGYQVTAGRVDTHDFHATILHLLGLDHERLTYHHAGRDYRLTDVHGRVVEGLLA